MTRFKNTHTHRARRGKAEVHEQIFITYETKIPAELGFAILQSLINTGAHVSRRVVRLPHEAIGTAPQIDNDVICRRISSNSAEESFLGAFVRSVCRPKGASLRPSGRLSLAWARLAAEKGASPARRWAAEHFRSAHRFRHSFRLQPSVLCPSCVQPIRSA